MALSNVTLAPITPSSCCCCFFFTRSSNYSELLGFETLTKSNGCLFPTVRNRWRSGAIDTRIGIVEKAPVSPSSSSRTATIVGNAAVDIPVSCYQLIGVSSQAEKDEIVKSVMNLKSAEVDDGYTMDVIVSRQEVLMDARDKLLFETEYAGNVKEKIPPQSSLRIPWRWLPAALCLLQEVGEEELVLEIGSAAVQRPDAKPYIHDLLLSMALAECSIAKIGFEKNKVSEGFEALARAQCLLRSTKSLRQMTLLSQIEESLEELAPACTLELLGLPQSPENADKRRGAIAALRELLRQGLDVETSCQVQDWSGFLSQALNRLLASEVVDILPWDNLAIARKNKKSIESQNQRVVIDFTCFYIALIAHIALGFSSRQNDLIIKAKTICECLITSEGNDLKLEVAFCLFLLGQGSEPEVIEKLQQLESTSNPAPQNSITGKEIRGTSSTNSLLDAVLSLFSDTRDCSQSLANYFGAERKAPESKKSKGAPQTMPNLGHKSLSTALASERRDFEDCFPHMKSSLHIVSAVKQLAPSDLPSPLLTGDNSSGSNGSASSVQLKRKLGVNQNKAWESWLSQRNVTERVTFLIVLGCIFFTSFKLSGMRLSGVRRMSVWASNKPHMSTSSLTCKGHSSLDYSVGSSHIKESGIGGGIKKLLELAKVQFRNPSDARISQSSCLPASLSTSIMAVDKKQMSAEEAEALVRHWQAIKAEALGPNHQVHILSEALDESMLIQWQTLADTAKARCCYWRFVLLQLTILRADILLDINKREMAEIEALIEEAAELVDESQAKNPNYYSTYKICYILRRQDDGSWKFCVGDIVMPS
ncbi:plastid division protein CDP1, chloroplastic-like isoform X2 [Durio zibethinus]|uniref:Plastid division protein CDP1, chloroplastic-like isoform X2 n=1 Tax=Durio zibethinus TaxID=66656 RepID=A0A6P5YPU0_DURZI|nr:plastid division protein CDP1, chloroplastic-like isoform X2 [Durio zibethinus]